MQRKRRNIPHRPERDRMVFEVLHAIQGRKASEVASKTYVAASTIAKWRKRVEDGGTRYPQCHTLAAVAAVAGLKFALVPDEKRHR